jgi:hypothetical protein
MKTIELIAGTPIKFQYAGQTEKGADMNGALIIMMDVRDYLIKLLSEQHEDFMSLYSTGSEAAFDYIRAAIASWSQTHNDEFSEWYGYADLDIKRYLQNIGLAVFEAEGKYIISNEAAFGEVPDDLFLPLNLREGLEAKLSNNDEKGEVNFGILTQDTGFIEVTTFGLGDWHSWWTLQSQGLGDQMYEWEYEAIGNDALFAGLQAQIDSYDGKIAEGSFLGAMYARQQHLLQTVKGNLTRAGSPEERVAVMKGDNRQPSPKTGVYVMHPISTTGILNPFAVYTPENYDEETVALLVHALREDRKGYNPEFIALEIPQKAVQYVPDRETLQVSLE